MSLESMGVRHFDISVDNMNSQISQLLYAFGLLNHSEEVESIAIGKQVDGVYPLSILLKRDIPVIEQEVTLIRAK
jgi:hypothetical protein